LILLLFWSAFLTAQDNKEKIRAMLAEATFNQKFDVGSNLMFDNVYSEALYVWEIMLETDPTNANLNYRAGMCLVHLNRETEALKYFEKAQYAVSRSYNPFSPVEKLAPPELFFYLAKANHVHGKIDTALYQYNFFISSVKPKHAHFEHAQLGLQQLKNAQEMMRHPKPFIIRNVGDIINTASPEYSPVITIDGSALFFTTKRLRKDKSNEKYVNIYNGQYYEDIYVSYRDRDGNWAEPVVLPFCSVRSNDASISASPDGEMVFVYQDVNGGDVYYSQLVDTAFGALAPYDAPELNTEYWEPHFTMSADGLFLFFVSDRPGGLGGRDIYRTRRLPDGTWSKPSNLGAPINTKYDEDSPFIGADDKTLFFSSNGPASMGGFDIFVSQVDELDVWSAPINMGYPLNSVDDDIFYTTTADGHIGFYASDKLEGKGDKDIYMVQSEESFIKNIAVFTGFILTSDHSMIPPGITIHVTDLTDNTKTQIYTPRRRDGGYVLTLKPCHTYDLDYRLEGHSIYKTEVYVPCNSSYQEISHELLLDLINLEASVLVSNLPEKESRWEFENSEYFGVLNGKKIVIYDGDKVVYEEFVNKHGQFPYRELDPTKSYVMKIKEGDFEFCETLVLNLVDGKNNVVDVYTFNDLCQTNPHVQEYSDILQTPIFQYNFEYNKDEFNTENEHLNEYVRGVKQILDAGKTLKILVTASASKVPTKKYHNNMELARRRLEIGEAIMTKVLKANGIDMTKIAFVEDEVLVGGPDYNHDAMENGAVYARYQYIKFEVRIDH
jgi:hypothetical protein